MRSARMPAGKGRVLTGMPETALPREHAADKLRGALAETLSEVSRPEVSRPGVSGPEDSGPEDSGPEVSGQRRKEEKILAYIDENLFHPFLSLEYVAQHFDKSSAYISSVFKKARGMRYVDYVNRCRVARAEDMLRKEGTRISDVCAAVGYVSLTTFRRNFIKYTGKLPTEFR